MRINVRGMTDTLTRQCSSLFEQLTQRWLRTTGILTIVLLTVLVNFALPARASDHQDTTFLATKLTAADLTDLFVFESPSDPSKVVLAMDFDPLITKGEVRPFDPAVLYQFKIDNTGDSVEDLVLQFRVNGQRARSIGCRVWPQSPRQDWHRVRTGSRNGCRWDQSDVFDQQRGQSFCRNAQRSLLL